MKKIFQPEIFRRVALAVTLMVIMGATCFLTLEIRELREFSSSNPQEVRLPSIYICFDNISLETTQVQGWQDCPKESSLVQIKRLIIQ